MPAWADQERLAAPCDELETVGGGALGVSPGPVGPPNSLGWDVGSGQCNGSFTVTADTTFPGGSLELGMRAEQRRIGQVGPTGNSYEVQTGADIGPPIALNRAWWNFNGSVAYSGDISTLDALTLTIRTDVGPNPPSVPAADLLALLGVINARNNEPNATAGFADLFQFSQNPEFGWFAPLPGDDTDGNPTGAFNYDTPGAWLMTLSATEAGVEASVAICIHTPGVDCLPDNTDLSISMTDTPDPVTAGTNLTYAVTVTNNGPADSTGGSVSDVLPAGVSFVSSADCTEMAGTVSCAIGALANGANQVVSFVVAVDAAQTAPIMNTVTVAPNETDPNAGNDTATSTTAVITSTDLSISKTAAPDPVTAGTNLTYTLNVTNNGPSDSTGGSVSDVLPAGVSFVSSADCTEAAGTVSCAIGALANGASQPVSFVVAVGSAQTGTIVNTATITANETDPTAANDSATANTVVQATADLAISKDDGVTAAIPGQSVTYAIVVSNGGPSDAPGSTVSDTFPAACTSVSWTCSGAGGATCTASGSGNIADVVSVPAAGSVTYTAVCSIDPAATGSLVNTASVAAAAGVTDPNAANNSASDTDTLTATADLAISKTDNATTAQVNAGGSYVITASNAGPSAAPGATVSDVFPANFTPGAWTCLGSGGGVCPASGSGNIAASVDLPAGASAVFTVAGTYAGTVGVVSNTATVAAAATVIDPNAANNSATDDTQIVSPASLSGIKVGIANMTVAGGSLNYVIEFSNAGPQDQLDNAGPEMVDVLPFGYVYLSANASSGTLSFDPATRTLEWSGPVAVGQTVSISINGSIDPAVAGTQISNQAEFRFDGDGNGSNEASALSDDPSQPGNADPTVVSIAAAVAVPTTGSFGLLLIGMLMMISGGLWLRSRA